MVFKYAIPHFLSLILCALRDIEFPPRLVSTVMANIFFWKVAYLIGSFGITGGLATNCFSACRPGQVDPTQVAPEVADAITKAVSLSPYSFWSSSCSHSTFRVICGGPDWCAYLSLCTAHTSEHPQSLRKTCCRSFHVTTLILPILGSGCRSTTKEGERTLVPLSLEQFGSWLLKV